MSNDVLESIFSPRAEKLTEALVRFLAMLMDKQGLVADDDKGGDGGDHGKADPRAPRVWEKICEWHADFARVNATELLTVLQWVVTQSAIRKLRQKEQEEGEALLGIAVDGDNVAPPYETRCVPDQILSPGEPSAADTIKEDGIDLGLPADPLGLLDLISDGICFLIEVDEMAAEDVIHSYQRWINKFEEASALAKRKNRDSPVS